MASLKTRLGLAHVIRFVPIVHLDPTKHSKNKTQTVIIATDNGGSKGASILGFLKKKTT